MSSRNVVQIVGVLLSALVFVAVGAAAAVSPRPEIPSSSPAYTPLPVAAGAPEVDLAAREFRFAPTEVHVPRGVPFRLVLDNTAGVVEHDLDVPGLGGLHVHALPGETVVAGLLVDAPPGRYPFSCTLPGHQAAGMTGVLVVEA